MINLEFDPNDYRIGTHKSSNLQNEHRKSSI